MSDTVPTSLRPERPSVPVRACTRSRSQASHRGYAHRCAPVCILTSGPTNLRKPDFARAMDDDWKTVLRWWRTLADTGRLQHPSAVSERVGHLPSVTPPRASVPKFAASPTVRVQRAAAAARVGGGAEKLRNSKCAKWPLRASSRRPLALAFKTVLSVVCRVQHPTIHLAYRISTSAPAIIPASESGAPPGWPPA